MILSMTGFGRAEVVFEGKKISIEIKSLNSKNFDLNCRIPIRYREKEFNIRKILHDSILRGKVDCYINVENLEGITEVKINQAIINNYIKELHSITPDAPDYELLKMAIKLPEAISSKSDSVYDEEWNALFEVVNQALDQFTQFRKTEGESLYKDLSDSIQNIDNNLQEVPQYEEERLTIIKERYQKALDEFDNIDETRYYQEVAYHSEKLDISEEKVRLKQHLDYFREVMNNESPNGKKLGFISQEIGREINTLGSKANQADIQKLVIKMKDDLEKIKEQTLNVL